MIASDGRPCLSDVGMHSSFSKVVFSEAWHVPWSWAFKPPEELSFDCDPSAFAPTKAMDIYSFANTVYTVCLCFMLVAFPSLTRYCLLSDRSSLPTHPSPPSQKGEGLRRSWLVVTSSKDPTVITISLWHILQRCWSYNPEDRPSISDVELALTII